jgi:hypothetical protein
MLSFVPGASVPGQLSVAASRLDYFVARLILGLTPQAMNMPPLRGSGRPIHFAAASRGHPTRMGAIRKRVPPLRGSARSPHADGGDHNMAPLHGFGGSPRKDGGHPVCQFRGARRAPKARQIFSLGRQPQEQRCPLPRAPKGRQIPSLGRQPQETAHPTPTSPEGATDSGPGCGRHDDWRKKWQEHSAT